MREILGFIVATLVSIIDPLRLIGYIVAGTCIRRMSIAITAGAVWAVLLHVLVVMTTARAYSSSVPGYIFVSSILGAAFATAVTFIIADRVRRKPRTSAIPHREEAQHSDRSCDTERPDEQNSTPVSSPLAPHVQMPLGQHLKSPIMRAGLLVFVLGVLVFVGTAIHFHTHIDSFISSKVTYVPTPGAQPDHAEDGTEWVRHQDAWRLYKTSDLRIRAQRIEEREEFRKQNRDPSRGWYPRPVYVEPFPEPVREVRHPRKRTRIWDSSFDLYFDHLFYRSYGYFWWTIAALACLLLGIAAMFGFVDRIVTWVKWGRQTNPKTN